MSKKRILFVNTEVSPYTPDTNLAQAGCILPQAMQESGYETRIFMPRFGCINERRNQLHEVIRLSGMNFVIADTDHPLVIKVASLLPQRIQVYFVDNDDYFSNRLVYADKNGVEYADQNERCMFFARGVVETVRKLRWIPDIIYFQGWFAAIAPMLIKRVFGEDPCFRNAKLIFGLYDNAFKTHWPSSSSQMIKIDGITRNDISEIRDKQINNTMLCNFAIKYCDGVVCADKGVDHEIMVRANELGKKVLDLSEEAEFDAQKYQDFFAGFFEQKEELEEQH